MKKDNASKFGILFVLGSVVLLAGFASALIRPDVRITDYSIQPALTPGGSAQLDIQLQNVGNDECADHVSVQIQPLTPLAVQGPDTHFLDSICIKNGPKNVSFTLLADQSATLSNNPVPISVSYESDYAAPYSTTQTANVPIQGTALLQAHVTSTNPVDVHPGDEATVQVNVENVGSAKADAATITLNAPAGLDVKANSKTQVVSELLPKKSVALTFDVFVPKTAAAQDYPLAIHAAFVDEYGKKHTLDLSAILTVKAKALFSAQTQETHLYAGANKLNVQFTITNTGTAAAKKLRIKLIPQFPFSTDGSERYIETLAAGANETADFTISVDKEATLGNYALQFQAVFEDDQSQKLQDTVDVNLTVPPKDLFTAIFLDYWFVWIALIAIAAFVLRGRMQKQGETKSKSKG